MFAFNSDYKTSERFDLAKFIEYVDEHLSYDVLNSEFLFKLRSVKPISEITISAKDEFLPDGIAYQIYGNELFWWIILYYNGLDSIDEFVAGTVVKLPDFTEIEKIFFNLRQRTNT
jgi:hypothetical protein